ncbi:hypothetical protein HNQ99_002390 [Rhizorhapis suberifaciens]|uniref:Uncharacterized protein n=1 Tax=Rhizorhapis suberifaciens TaxID=13656 RepID=A0A840HX23_9SPHN|nr:hypothetical protein [Rhizorhapis suberifaciens]
MNWRRRNHACFAATTAPAPPTTRKGQNNLKRQMNGHIGLMPNEICLAHK